MLAEDAREEQAMKKFNKKLLAEFTGYTGDTLRAFYRYLGFSTDYILENQAYDIYLHVQTQLANFEQQLQATNTLLDTNF